MFRSEFSRAHAAFAITFVLSTATANHAAPPLFSPARLSLPVEAKATELVVADFNADGDADIAFTSYFTDEVGVRLGRGDRSFSPARYRPTGSRPQGLAAGDLDGDGRLDLVVGHRSTDSVAVFLGRDGGFDEATYWFAGTDPRSVAIGDLNGDGMPDIVVGKYTSPSGAALLGVGGGAFAAPIFFNAGQWARSVTIGLLDGDDVPDLAFSGAGGASVCLGLGDGTFGTASLYRVGNPGTVAIGDLDHDGDADLVTTSQLDDAIAVLLGAGDGTFGAASLYASRAEPFTVGLGDVDGDGALDVATTNFYGENVSVHRGRGDGTLEPAVYHTVGDFPGGLALGDIDGDGALDIVAQASSTIWLLTNGGDGSFEWPRVPGGRFTNAVAVGDLTGDGVPDLAITSYYSEVAVVRGLGDGTFVPWSLHDIGSGSEAVGIADFDRNGVLDLAVSRSPLGGVQEVVVLLGEPGGVLTTFGSFEVACGPDEMVIEDLNGDGWPDIATVGRCAAGVSVLLGSGDGGFRPVAFFAAGVGPRDLAVGDLNGDGAPDLVAANSNTDDVSVLIGAGDGTFAPSVSYPVADFPFGVAIGDLDQDGRPDVVATSYDSITREGYVTVMSGDGDGGFESPDFYESGPYFSHAPILADFDGNGVLDLAVASAIENSLMLFRGTRRGLVDTGVRYGTGENPRAIAAGDLDGDGDLDLAIACLYSDEVVILPGTPPVVLAVGERGEPRPVEKGLLAAGPNPFREGTRVRFDLPQDLPAAGPACVDIYDVVGRRVRTLIDGTQAPGSVTYDWDGRDAAGRSVGSGVYFVRLQVAGDVVATRKIVRTR